MQLRVGQAVTCRVCGIRDADIQIRCGGVNAGQPAGGAVAVTPGLARAADADKFAGQVVVITLCAAVKAGFLYQPVKYIVTEGGVAAVFTGQADDPSGSIVFHTARQPALRGTDGLSPRIVLCPVSAAVRGNDGGQVTGDVVFIPRFMALRVFHRS
ncbi:Uncharacterised protein [Escherichia coli]|nr:Uncharacterised protein [Escherichia coli]